MLEIDDDAVEEAHQFLEFAAVFQAPGFHVATRGDIIRHTHDGGKGRSDSARDGEADNATKQDESNCYGQLCTRALQYTRQNQCATHPDVNVANYMQAAGFFRRGENAAEIFPSQAFF